MHLAPSYVRQQVLSAHVILRHAMRRLSEALTAGSPTTIGQAARSLFAMLRSHMTVEEAILAPTLEGIDAWGPQRAARLHQDHAAQGLELDRLERMLDDPAETAGLPPVLHSFVDWLGRDMAEEERDLLDADVLRDDPISIDAFGG